MVYIKPAFFLHLIFYLESKSTKILSSERFLLCNSYATVKIIFIGWSLVTLQTFGQPW